MPEFDPTFMAGLLVSCGALLWIANQVKHLLGHNKAPQPFAVMAAEKFCPLVAHEECKRETKARFAEVEQRLNHIDQVREESLSKLYEATAASLEKTRLESKNDIRSLHAEIKADIGGVHDRINDVLSAVSTLKGAMEKK